MASAPYLDPSQPIETRIKDLLTRMTLAEKCAQLVGPFGLDESDVTIEKYPMVYRPVTNLELIRKE